MVFFFFTLCLYTNFVWFVELCLYCEVVRDLWRTGSTARLCEVLGACYSGLQLSPHFRPYSSPGRSEETRICHNSIELFFGGTYNHHTVLFLSLLSSFLNESLTI